MNENVYTIVVTDSGLGGLNVAAKIRKNLNGQSFQKSINVIYFNALPARGMGYNSMSTLEQKAKVFNSALNGMVKNYNPDIILIACNTLSVVYESTEFFLNPTAPVMGIVDLGVNLVVNSVPNNNYKVVLFGTPTTIAGNSHKNRLINKGFKEEDIIPQACKNLESEIQNDAFSEQVRKLITEYFYEAVPNIELNTTYLFALCCTHYEFSLDQFDQVIKKRIKDYKILNPNELMSVELNKYLPAKADNSWKVNVKVVSRTKIIESDIENIAELIKPISVEFAEALRNYELNENLFSIL